MAEYSAALANIDWRPLADATPPADYCSWLAEQGSMTRRLEQQCDRLQVTVLREGAVDPTQLSDDECRQLSPSVQYWLREVILLGDGIPWLFGRTLTPSSTLEGEGEALRRLGSTPLGRYLFSGVALERESLRVGCLGLLWARRSRLRVAGQPLLLTELFLADAPIYGR
ncbi:chorismate lyase [Edwardsiella ictaluri]|uniref:Chorismate pyruvate-lyase n=2 Tax=Edwardsiella ictaluri TaxID=67780 RepID=C5B703_EDWI9|nr:chorismate lyase [Edwardsiella ictaluri]ACR67465.1 chorismate-pyruvate lyase, putative [Edwardsiella ictaluri 93-146]EKS7763411.1 chorismate lyase [Edwardsiella ictaluri]EKS7770231.1 chorismate lyase [Edwardsiella ictaluri]EKS7773372.1 chorismate lyase [Edwardsiella ictaluri]EKS7776840.1 chorismate lyase [Edwardsiella ictaluri]